MINLSFNQTKAEILVRSAATVLFNALRKITSPVVELSNVAGTPQYGFTASATWEEVGPKFVRITDLQDASINWETVPRCVCDRSEQYLLFPDDILFARTGATTGKTHIVRSLPYDAIFASYLIRVRAKKGVLPEYLYSFFQSDAYWEQIVIQKEGSAQPNVNGRKLTNIKIPLADPKMQAAISQFIDVVRARQDGSDDILPQLPSPLSDQRRIVARIEELAAKIEEARGLRREAVEEAEVLLANSLSHVFDYQHPDSLPNGWEWKPLDDLLLNKKEGMVTGPFGTLLQKSDVQSDGIPILGIANVQANHFVSGFSDHVSPWKADTLSSYRLDQEDIVIARSGTVGRSCVIPTGIDPAPIMSTNLMRLRLDTKIFLPRLLCSLFNGSRLVERHKDLECRGSTRSFFTQKILTKLQIPVPPLSKQHHILSYLEDLQAKVNKLKRLQTETAEELDALLPSVLDKAFRGEL